MILTDSWKREEQGENTGRNKRKEMRRKERGVRKITGGQDTIEGEKKKNKEPVGERDETRAASLKGGKGQK